ncbi:DUF488 domain-containing protein [Corallococcus sp. CA047B]|uniref:DUF488 domain-containing protein n=1 Tax=Corallococcus sp. CA047B TaxID=2316729 RepID=UPI000EA05B6B|nr:DUF488 domain-containing protein [Corallococcus sp. CA047B]RKH16781.1 DUF488 domain-containing protein [Corallococcus sp. CA047B]
MVTRLPRRAPGWSGVQVFALGHSTRTVEELVGMLWSNGVRTLVDIRTVPRSRHNPQFNVDVLGPLLAQVGVEYLHLAALGGLRHARKDSPNGAWRNASFRGYADYMLTEDFARGLEALREIALRGPVAVMCAEALRWRCHRSLLADALWARGVQVMHITSPTRVEPHPLTAFARLHGRQVLYPEGADAVSEASAG